MKHINTLSLAESAWKKHRKLHHIGHYTGIVSLHGICRLAVSSGMNDLLKEAGSVVQTFLKRDSRLPQCNYENYRCGGNGTAWMLWKGFCPEAEQQVLHFAEDFLVNAPKNSSGIAIHPKKENSQLVFIDQAFAITPFMLFAGLYFQEPRYVDEAVKQTLGMIQLLRDPENDLLHQSIGKLGPGVVSQDHWSRGNGWGLYALTELINELPQSHPSCDRVYSEFRRLVNACLHFSDENGLLHQEITDHSSYVETSGSGLFLYALGAGLEHGLIDSVDRERLRKGLRSMLSYIALDGSVHNTCQGCLAPGDGSIEAYKDVASKLNDPHAFGPVCLAFGQAAKLDIYSL